MKWNVKDHPENRSKIKWIHPFKEIIKDELSAALGGTSYVT